MSNESLPQDTSIESFSSTDLILIGKCGSIPYMQLLSRKGDELNNQLSKTEIDRLKRNDKDLRLACVTESIVQHFSDPEERKGIIRTLSISDEDKNYMIDMIDGGVNEDRIEARSHEDSKLTLAAMRSNVANRLGSGSYPTL